LADIQTHNDDQNEAQKRERQELQILFREERLRGHGILSENIKN
jgi:hypothetical protein